MISSADTWNAAPRGTATALFIHCYRSQVMSNMKTKLKVIALSVLLGTATVAAAQDPSTPTPGRAQTFADQIQYWQGLSGIGTYTFHSPPRFSNKPQDPVGNESSAQRFADMQAESSNDSDMWQETQPTLSAKAADPEPKESFGNDFTRCRRHRPTQANGRSTPARMCRPMKP